MVVFFGDGAQRGPDFTAEALHEMTLAMSRYYITEFKTKTGNEPTANDISQIKEQVKLELKQNHVNSSDNMVTLSAAQLYALEG